MTTSEYFAQCATSPVCSPTLCGRRADNFYNFHFLTSSTFNFHSLTPAYSLLPPFFLTSVVSIRDCIPFASCPTTPTNPTNRNITFRIFASTFPKHQHAFPTIPHRSQQTPTHSRRLQTLAPQGQGTFTSAVSVRPYSFHRSSIF